jgi:hypothetical protein
MLRPLFHERGEVAFVERLVDRVEPLVLLLPEELQEPAAQVAGREPAEGAGVVVGGDLERFAAEREPEWFGLVVEFERVEVERVRHRARVLSCARV